MKLKKHGKDTSTVDIHITPNGMWLLIADKEYFLPYEEYPWFKDATISQIHNVEFSHAHHLHWPDIDVDLDVDSLDHPEKYPLKSQK
jgi:hypothetical protein